MVIAHGRPSDARKVYIEEGQIAHDKIIRLGWQNKFGTILDRSSEKIGRLRVVKPEWWKAADYDVSENPSKPRDIEQLVTILKFPPKVRRFKPHEEPGPEIMDHLPRMSLQLPVDPEKQKILTEENGSLLYLHQRYQIPLNLRVVRPPNVNAEYAWGILTQEPAKNETDGKQFGRHPMLMTEMYRQTGVINGKKCRIPLDLTTRRF